MADRKRLMDLLNYHQRAAQSLAFALELMNGHARATKRATTNGTLAAALQVEADRHAAKPTTKKRNSRDQSKKAKLARRRLMARVLKRYSTSEPRPWVGGRGGIGTAIHHGYLKHAGDDARGKLYLRTAKPFDVDKVQS